MTPQSRFRFLKHRLSWSQVGLLVSLLVVAGSSAYLALQLAGRQDAKQTTLARGQADYYASTVHMLRYNHEGLASMQLRADRLEHVPDREQLKLIEPKLWLSSADSHTQISAREGMTSDDGQSASLSGSVVIVRKTLQTPSLQIQGERALIDASKERIELPDEVRIEQGERWVTGRQLVLDQAEKQLRLGARVQAFFPASQNESLHAGRAKP